MKRIVSSVVLALIFVLSTLITCAQRNVDLRRDPSNNESIAATSGTTVSSPKIEGEIVKLNAVVADQQKRIEQLEQMVNEQKKLIEQALHISEPARTEDKPLIAASVPTSDSPSSLSPIKSVTAEDASPLSLRIGKVSITPYGFLELTTIIRDRDIGSGIGTNFGSIPFSNTVQGNLSEFRFTPQNTRLGARFDARFGGMDILGLVETDFNGFAPGNVAVTTNSEGLRMRLAWIDLRKGKWEVLGGQSWSLLTPNRKGTSPIPADVFSTQNIDQSIQVGLTWARQPQFRMIYHAGRTVTAAVSFEAAEQYAGGSAGAGKITLPADLTSSYASQLDIGDSTFAAPNLHPDVIAKLAFDPKVGGHDLHLEVAGLLSSFRFFDPRDQTKHNVTGGGVSAGVNFQAFRNFRLIANGFYSDGGGRYIFGLAPDVTINADGTPSLVHSASTVDGIEYQVGAKDLFDAYYGGAFIDKSTAVDTNGQFVGYGYPNSPLSHNRSLQQVTFGYTRTFWRDPAYGALQLIGQYSYVVRHPWFVPTGEPTGATSNYLYMSIRYVLPGAPPAKTGQ
jgi:hypothetical protein